MLQVDVQRLLVRTQAASAAMAVAQSGEGRPACSVPPRLIRVDDCLENDTLT